MAKRKQKKKNGEFIIKLATIVAITIVIIIVYNFIKNLQTVKISDKECEFFQYVVGGQKIEYKGVLKMSKNNGITELQTEEGILYLDSTPVYYKDEKNKVILPNEMAVAFPLEKGMIKKINSFSNIYIKYDEIYVENGNLNKKIEDAFLYDGSDLYFFINNTTIKINEIEYKLSPLSYINVTHNGYVELYDYDTDTYTFIENVEGNVIASTTTYTINLSVDTVKYEASEQILLKKIKNLSNLE